MHARMLCCNFAHDLDGGGDDEDEDKLLLLLLLLLLLDPPVLPCLCEWCLGGPLWPCPHDSDAHESSEQNHHHTISATTTTTISTSTKRPM